MKRREPTATNVVEADLRVADKKLPRIQVAGSLVLGVAYLSVPLFLLLAVVRHGRLDFDSVTSVILLGGFAVAGLFGYAGYRLIHRALR
jgi:hypothetical protein